MYVCLLSQDGDILLHRNRPAAPEPFRQTIAPYREGLGVAVEWLFTWYGLADLCAAQGIAFVLGQALSWKAIHGGKAKNDRIDSQKIAALLRGGRLPQASVSPAERRATRDRLRRRTPLLRQRADHFSHGQHTHRQYTLPEIGKTIASNANREGVAERFTAPAVHQTIEVDLALLSSDDELRRDFALSLVKAAKPHDAHTLYRLPTVPGIGKSLSLVLRYAIPQIARVPSVQDLASYGRLVTCAKESGGKRLGTSGKTIGNAPLKWAFAEAAAVLLRNHEAGQTYLARLAQKHDQGKALTILAHTLARAVSDMRKRQTACDRDRFLRTSGSRAREPGVSLATERGACLARTPWPV
jgi:transposase